MKDEYLEVSRYSETLYFTQHGEWVLDIQGGIQRKVLTPKQAEAWYKSHYPRGYWASVIERNNYWLGHIKPKEAGSRPKKR